MIADIHAHLMHPHALEVAGPHGAASGFGARPHIPPPGSRFAQINALMLDPARQVAAMDERGVDVHLVSAILAVTPTGWAPADVALDLCRPTTTPPPGRPGLPDAAGGLVHPAPPGSGPGTGRARALLLRTGLRVVQLPANVGGVYLGEPPLRPLWDEIAGMTCSSSSTRSCARSVVPALFTVEFGRPADRGGQGAVLAHLRGRARGPAGPAHCRVTRRWLPAPLLRAPGPQRAQHA